MEKNVSNYNASNADPFSIFEDYPDVVTPGQLQQMVNISKKTVYRLLKDGHIECRKIGREYKIPKINIIKYLLGQQ